MSELSRTQKKKRDRALQKLGEDLVALSKEHLEQIPLPDDLAEAVTFAKTVRQHSARRRQLQYIGVLMRNLDPEPIQAAMARLVRGEHDKVQHFKNIENLRNALISGDDQLLETLLNSHAGLDREELTALVKRARIGSKGLASSNPSRRLFRYLSAAIGRETGN